MEDKRSASLKNSRAVNFLDTLREMFSTLHGYHAPDPPETVDTPETADVPETAEPTDARKPTSGGAACWPLLRLIRK